VVRWDIAEKSIEVLGVLVGRSIAGVNEVIRRLLG